MSSANRKKIAVIGGGISGLTAAYYLGKTGNYEISLFESQSRLGGHAHTLDYQGSKFDTTVISFHTEAYPNFVKLVKELNLYHETVHFKQDLCFHTEEGIEYMMSYNPVAMLLKPFTIANTLRVFKKLSALVVQSFRQQNLGDISLQDYLERSGFSAKEIDLLVIPLIHMFVGLPLPQVRKMPASFWVKHLYDHKLLHHSSLHSWRGWRNGTASYISKLQKTIQGKIFTSARIKQIEAARNGRWQLCFEDGEALPQTFDYVIIATPPAPSLRLLKQPTSLESELLGPWSSFHLRKVVHFDDSVLPKSNYARSFWNPYIQPEQDACGASYLVHKIHPEVKEEIIVSWEPIQPIDPARVYFQEDVEIGHYTNEALKSHGRLSELNLQKHGIFFCGAHMGLGWHEAGVSSALAILPRIAELDILRSRRPLYQSRQAAVSRSYHPGRLEGFNDQGATFE